MSALTPFARQIALPEVGTAGQTRFARAHVLVIGAGGLGSPVLMYLAAAGIGQITVVDPDHVERSNLHRQPLFTHDDIGRPKVEAAALRLRAMAPDLRLHTHQISIGASTVNSLIQNVDIVVDAADSFAVSYILSDACLAAGKLLITASVLGLSGYVAGVCGNAPSLRAVFPDLPDRAATCASAGVLGPLVGMVGAAQAQLVLHALLDLSPSAAGQMLSFAMDRLRPSSFRFDGALEPSEVLRFEALRREAVIVDLRDVEEAPVTVHPEALRILPTEIATTALPQDRAIQLTCATGLRAWRAARVLQERGYSDLSLHAVCAP